MPHVETVILESTDPAAADAFHHDAFGLGERVQARAGRSGDGFRGFVLSLVVAQPSSVDLLVAAAVDAGATAIKPAAKSLWGYGGSVQAPDGTIWTIASSSKKDRGPATREVDDVVLLLGVADVKASKRLLEDRGLTVKRSFGGKYAEFDAPATGIKLALNGRVALAKNAGVDPDGTGPSGLAIATGAGAFTDLDGFAWEPVGVPQPA